MPRNGLIWITVGAAHGRWSPRLSATKWLNRTRQPYSTHCRKSNFEKRLPTNQFFLLLSNPIRGWEFTSCTSVGFTYGYWDLVLSGHGAGITSLNGRLAFWPVSFVLPKVGKSIAMREHWIYAKISISNCNSLSEILACSDLSQMSSKNTVSFKFALKGLSSNNTITHWANLLPILVFSFPAHRV